MVSSPSLRSHEEAVRVLRRTGYADESIREILRELPDPFDLQRYSEILARCGVSPELLMDRMGGSP